MTTAEKSTQQGAYVHANGIDIYYEEYGSGHPLLLIHGGIVDHTMWESHIPIFAQHFRVIAVDCRGHGRSKNPLDTMSYRLLADDMAAFIQALGVQKPLVCGYSLGGSIGFEMGIHYPHLVKAYVLGGIGHKWEGRDEMFKSWGIDAPGVVDIARTKRDNPELYEMLLTYQAPYQGVDHLESFMSQCSHMYLDEEYHYSAEELSKIEAPTLVINGDSDEIHPVEEALYVYRALPNAELSIFPGADHFFFWPRPELFCATIIDFFARQSQPSA